MKHPIMIVRDTGGNQLVNLKSSVPSVEQCYTSEKICILDFHGPLAKPLAKLNINCPLVKGEVTVAVCSNGSSIILDCDFLSANDLLGTKFSSTSLSHYP